MKRKWYKGQFGVESIGISDEFRPQGYAYKVQNFDLRKFGIRTVPVIGRISHSRLAPSSDWHVHDGCFEFICCTSGTSEYECNGQRNVLRPGLMFFSRVHEMHRQAICPKGFAYYQLQFRPGRTKRSRWLADAFNRLPHLFPCRPAVPALFREILSLVGSGKADPDLCFRLEAMIQMLLIEIIDSASFRRTRAGSGILQEMARRMRETPAADYRLPDLIAEAGMSRATFISVFKTLVGLTPHAYHSHCRIEAAKMLLRAGKSVESVSVQLSFPTVSHFIRTFRSFTGTTPAKWKARKMS